MLLGALRRAARCGVMSHVLVLDRRTTILKRMRQLSVLAFLLVACGDDDGPPESGNCARIVAACHDLDPGSGPIHDCHEVGHDEVESACIERIAYCLVACSPSDGGSDATDAGMHDAHVHDAESHEH